MTRPKTFENYAKWNVLIVEDDLKTRAELLRAIRAVAHCTTTGNGGEALEIFFKAAKKQKRFDFILLDITLPAYRPPAGRAGTGRSAVNGFEVLKTIRAHEESASVKKPTCIIMVTAYKDSLMSHYNMGWDAFITKPLDEKKLIEKMRALLTSRTQLTSP